MYVVGRETQRINVYLYIILPFQHEFCEATRPFGEEAAVLLVALLRVLEAANAPALILRTVPYNPGSLR